MFNTIRSNKRQNDCITGFLPFWTISRSARCWLAAVSANFEGQNPSLAVFTAIFSLPFCGVNFSRGIVNNPEVGFQKDSACEILKNPRYK